AALMLDDAAEQLRRGASAPGAHHAPDRGRLVLEHHLAVRRDDPLDDEGPEQRAAVGDRRERGRHLHGGDRDALAEAERREVDVGPALDGPHDARRLTGQLDARPATEAEGAQVAMVTLPAETLTDLGRPDVARVLDHLGERQPPVRMRVVDRPPGRLEAAALAEEELARRDHPLLDRRRGAARTPPVNISRPRASRSNSRYCGSPRMTRSKRCSSPSRP